MSSPSREGRGTIMAAGPPIQTGEEKWLQKTGLEPCLVSRIAYAVITSAQHFVRSADFYRNKYHFLCLEGAIPRMLSPRLKDKVTSWRLPVYDLSIHQLAAIFDHAMTLALLSQKGIKLDYPEEPGENHPLFLAYASGGSAAPYQLQRNAKDYRFKTGSVTVARNPNFSPEAPVVQLDTPLHGSCLDLALQNKHMSLVLHTVPDYFKVLEGADIVPAIKCLWLALDHVREHGQLDEICLWSFLKYSGGNSEVRANLFLLCCHLLNAPTREASRRTCSQSWHVLEAMVKQAAHEQSLDLLTQAARYCTQAQLHRVISFLEGEDRSGHSLNMDCRHEFSEIRYRYFDPEEIAAALKVFQDEREGRTLKHEAVLTILRSVGGDAKRAKTLTDLSEPLLDWFKVPFQDLYDRLTESAQ